MVSRVSKLQPDFRLPSLAQATEWLNAKSGPQQVKGHPTLVHFWSISSETAKTNLAQVAELRDQRRREGLRVIAVHVPQSEAEKSARAVRDAITRLNLTSPAPSITISRLVTGRKTCRFTSCSIRMASYEVFPAISKRSRISWTS